MPSVATNVLGPRINWSISNYIRSFWWFCLRSFSFGLWKEQRAVDAERSPFATYQLMPRTAMMMGHLK